MANAGVGGPTLPGPGCPLEGGGLRREAETLTSLDPKPNSHSSCIALFYDPFIKGTIFTQWQDNDNDNTVKVYCTLTVYWTVH